MEQSLLQRREERRFPDRLKLSLAFDPILLRRDLEALAAMDWTSHFVTQNYEGDWSAIPLRCVAGAKHPIMMIYSDPGATAFEDTPMLDACDYFRQVLAAFDCELRSVRLMRLTPGSVIKEHRDPDLHAEAGIARIHIPITTNPDVDFRLSGSRVVLEPGEVWYLRLSEPHSVINQGAADRVHMVLDVETNAWLERLLEGGVAA